MKENKHAFSLLSYPKESEIVSKRLTKTIKNALQCSGC